MFVHDTGGLLKPSFIINFPTKDHWRGKSHLAYIRDGLVDLTHQVRRLGITSIAVAPLGCGNGGLDWDIVRPMIEATFAELPDVDVRLFQPHGAPAPKSMEVRTDRPKMTAGRAAILKLLETYRELDYGLSRVEVQKLAYFLQAAGRDLNLRFEKHHYGPYSDALRHAVTRLEGHFIRGLGDGVVEAEIEPTEDALAEADAFIASTSLPEFSEQLARVAALIEGFQSPFGMELLSTVHWVATQEPSVDSVPDAVRAVHAWSERKANIFPANHVAAAWNQLAERGWIQQAAH
jgi:O-acetyl-ADP-ribose deacetylase (regulator of RNase III)